MTYLIGHERVEPGAPTFGEALARCHATHSRPLCLCRDPGAPMYVSRSAGGYVVKRMPGSADQHQPWCSSYEAPAELGGRAEVEGTAIQEDADDGLTRLNLGFALTRGASRKAAAADQEPANSVKAERAKLGLLALLHYLWEEARLNHWAPPSPPRNWAQVHRRLITASAGKLVRGLNLPSKLYVPEPFTPDRKFEIAQRRSLHLAPIIPSAGVGSARPLMIIVAELKEIAETRQGQDLVVKQAPGFRLTVQNDTYRRIAKRFETEIDGWRAAEGRHLMLVATFSLAASGVATVEEAALMLTSPEWIPLEDVVDAALIAQLVHDDRRFSRTLRYNLPKNRPISVATLVDTRPHATALFVRQPDGGEAVQTVRGSLASQSEIATWIWDMTDEAGPRLPARSTR